MCETFCENCSHFILKWFQLNSFGEICLGQEKKNSLLVHRCPSRGRVGRSGKVFFFLSFFFFSIALKSAMWANILHIKHSHSTEIRTNNTFKVKSAFILQCSKWNFCVSTMYNNMKCPILKPYLKIWQWRKLFTGGTSLHGPYLLQTLAPVPTLPADLSTPHRTLLIVSSSFQKCL